MTTRQAQDGRTAVGRSLGVLGAFDEGHRTLTLSQISRRAQLPLATTHRMTAELVAARLLVRGPDGSYRIGAGCWRLGLLSAPTTLREAAMPHLQDLVAATGHTVHLAVLEGSGAMVVERLAGTRTIATRHKPGAVLPLHCTGVGKALLAHADPAVQGRVLASLPRFTAFTVTDPHVLERQLEEIRRTGIARSAQEHRVGTSSLAMPILTEEGLVAAIAVIAALRTPRLSGSLVPMRAAVSAIAAGLSRQTLANEAG